MGEAQDFEQRLKEVADRVTVALDQLIPPAGGPEADLMRAMRHAALANGKRMRPFFLRADGESFGEMPVALCRKKRICLFWNSNRISEELRRARSGCSPV